MSSVTTPLLDVPLRGDGHGRYRVHIVGNSARLGDTLAACPRGWVVDGDYAQRVGGVLAQEVTDVLWLDPPLALYFPRLCWRTLLRLAGLRDSCAPGCPERARETFCSWDSILWWCVSQHWERRRVNGARMRVEGVHVGGTMRRIGGWGGDLRAWRRNVEDMVRAQ
ncbi:hypothetical protein BC834DRAFT_842726 [Gloeopeniophorella convolvens]|nr:hypothetical protein BC834DRAFT_842726 [Gloeopeniophorella convolvens]